MSQRLHNCINNTNLETIHCEAYASRLQRRGKYEPQKPATHSKPSRERSTARSSTVAAAPGSQYHGAVATVPKKKTSPVRQTNVDLKSDSTAPNIIHKELYSDNSALVEVTVKAHNGKKNPRTRSNSRSRNRDPWCKLLKTQMSYENLSTFNNFDPLRTLHFLARELQNKLNDSLPYDKSVQQMIIDMQMALNRIPPEVASTVVLYNANENFARKTSSSELRPSRLKASNSKENVVPAHERHHVADKSVQTTNNHVESEKLQRHLEESSTKIEMACRQMETVCSRLKSEKEELEIMLRAEKETVNFLRKQMEDFENERIENANGRVINLQQEKEDLSSEVKKLKVQIESQQGPTSQELKSLIQDLRKQKSDADEQVALLNHQLTLLNMEKEKYVAILSARDRQIKEIRCEMNQLQEVVNEQLIELQNAPCSSVPSSLTNITNEQPSWLLMKPKDKFDCAESFAPAQLYANESTLQNLFVKDTMPSSSFKEIPSGDSSGMSSSTNDMKGKSRKMDPFARLPPQKDKASSGHSGENKMSLSETHANIRDMFAEIKKQALLVTAPAPTQKMNDIDMYRSEQSIKK